MCKKKEIITELAFDLGHLSSEVTAEKPTIYKYTLTTLRLG